jgi:lysophospholipid acyltransferase
MIMNSASLQQHGIAGGYYLTFLLGGFVTTAGRLCRANIRPLFLPAVPPSSPSAPALHPNKSQVNSHKPEKAFEPPRTLMKQIYDLFGSAVSLMVLNFTVAPFVIGGFYDSVETWRRMQWYGLWMVGGALVFFSAGGKTWLRSLAQRRARRAEKRIEEETKGVRVFTPNSGAVRTPGPHVVPPVDLAL